MAPAAFRLVVMLLSIFHKQSLLVRGMAFSTSASNNAKNISSSGAALRRRRILVDTDAGFDDVVAIQSLLAHDHSIDLVATVCGSNTASATHDGLRRLFPHLTTVASVDRRRPSQAWLPGFRQRFADFVEQHGVVKQPSKIDILASNNKDKDLSNKVESLLTSSPDDSIDLICLGPLSNVADWCDKFPTLLSTKVSSVWILGGSHPDTPREEFNFGQDSAAAAAVMESQALRDKIYLVPGDATSSHLVSNDYIQTIVQSTSPDDCSDNNLLANVVREEQHYSIFYDPVCAFLYLYPGAAQYVTLPLHVCPKTGHVSMGTTTEHASYRLVSKVDFGAYQTWLLQAIRQSEPNRIETS